MYLAIRPHGLVQAQRFLSNGTNVSHLSLNHTSQISHVICDTLRDELGRLSDTFVSAPALLVLPPPRQSRLT